MSARYFPVRSSVGHSSGAPAPGSNWVIRPLVEEGMRKTVSLVWRRGQALSNEAECLKRFLIEWMQRSG